MSEPDGFMAMFSNRRPKSSRLTTKLGRRIVFKLLEKLQTGRLTLRLADSTFEFGPTDADLHGTMEIADDSLFYDLLTGAELHLALGYIFKKWDSPNTDKVLLILLLNAHLFQQSYTWTHLLPQAMHLRRSLGWGEASTQEEATDLARQAYGIGHDFLTTMIGSQLLYSTAIWAHPSDSYEEAQRNKMRIIASKLRLDDPGTTVLDIGCGWGTMAGHLQQEHQANVTGIALSTDEIEHARTTYPRCTFRYQDYRDLADEEAYDRVVSVGLLEHIEVSELAEFFSIIAAHLKPGGLALIHTHMYLDSIFVSGNADHQMPTSSSLVTAHPGLTIGTLSRAVMNTGNLRVVHTESYDLHCARTCRVWRDNLLEHRERLEQTYSEALLRSYTYAWDTAAAALETGTTLVHVLLERKPYGSSYETWDPHR